MELDERKRAILALVIGDYIRTGVPVGSVSIMQKLPTVVSSATVRNDMAFLERAGFLMQPHTSAGRIPTPMGYRYYIDFLMKKHHLSDGEKENVRRAIHLHPTDPENLVQSFCESVSSFTHLAAMATTPAPKQSLLRQIQVIRAGRRVVFAALITDMGVVKNRSFRTDLELRDEDLVVLNTFLNAKLCRLPIESVTPADAQTLLTELGDYALILTPLVIGIYLLAQEVTGSRLFISGKTNLLHNSTSTLTTIRLLRLLENPSLILPMMEQVSENGGVVLGEETDCSEMEGSVLISVPYSVKNAPVGHLGLIGPQRMNYGLLIPYTEYLAAYLGKILSSFYED